MNWTVTLFPENGWHKPRVLRNVVEYQTLRSPTKYKGTRELTYATFIFANGGHITVLMDNNIHENQQSYRKFEIHNHMGNFVVAHGRRSPFSHKGTNQ